MHGETPLIKIRLRKPTKIRKTVKNSWHQNKSTNYISIEMKSEITPCDCIQPMYTGNSIGQKPTTKETK